MLPSSATPPKSLKNNQVNVSWFRFWLRGPLPLGTICATTLLHSPLSASPPPCFSHNIGPARPPSGARRRAPAVCSSCAPATGSREDPIRQPEDPIRPPGGSDSAAAVVDQFIQLRRRPRREGVAPTTRGSLCPQASARPIPPACIRFGARDRPACSHASARWPRVCAR